MGDYQYMGTIFLWAPNFAPRCTTYCHGQLLEIGPNTALFSLLGTIYGGDGINTFGVPDFRGRVPVGAGTGPGLRTYRLGEKSGVEMHHKDANFLPAHTHSVRTETMSVTLHASAQDANKAVPEAGDKLAVVVNADGEQQNTYYSGEETANVVIDTAATVSGEITVDASGSDGYIDNRQPFSVVNYILVTMGLFPYRN